MMKFKLSMLLLLSRGFSISTGAFRVMPMSSSSFHKSFIAISGRRLLMNTASQRQRRDSCTSITTWERFLSSSDSSSVENHEEKLVQMQKKTSSAATTEQATMTDQQQFLQHQQAVFDDMSDFFASHEATPPDVVPIMQRLAKRMIQQMLVAEAQNRDEPSSQEKTEQQDEEEEGESSTRFHILDIGCGTGALVPFLLEAADEADITLDITGVDLSPKMVKLANERTGQLLKEQYRECQHTVNAVCQDFVSMILGDDYHAAEESDAVMLGLEDESTAPHRGTYDAVISNACFGNFLHPLALLSAMVQSIREKSGMLFVTHPLGSDFVRKLHEEDSSTVPHPLPTKSKLNELAQFQPLEIMDFTESMQMNTDDKPVYFASLRRVPHRRLPRVMRLRAMVDAGYGRGGKKLGFPTANLPSSLFQNALENVSTGVYFGWAVIEDPTDTKSGRNVPQKAAVNVGYSPTFEGQENKEKIIEAHFILDEPLSDFYNETMRLSLIGGLRPEKKFESFPALVAAITNDVKNAKAALDLDPFSEFRTDSFLTNISPDNGWIGKSGGDETASWEFQSVTSTAD